MGKLILTMLCMCLLAPLSANAGSREQARRIHDRLTGIPPSDQMLDAMESVISDGGSGAVEAAGYAIDGAPGVAASGAFYTVTLKNWSTPWTNESRDGFAPLNDYSATIIGMVRDEEDFREILSGNIIYTGAVAGAPPYSLSHNEHYLHLEASGANLADSGVLVRNSQSSITGIPTEGVAGVLTTRAAARAFLVDGTNRAMLRFTLINHLCTDMEQIKDTSRPTDRIRQDVSRSPGGDSTLFLNQCVGCHGGLDAIAGAFAFYNFPYPDAEELPGLELEERKDRGQLQYTPGQVQAKYLINASTFAAGFASTNDHWVNYWRLGENSGRFGWRSASQNTGVVDEVLNEAFSEGDGAASLGRELANSEAFANCQVKKVFHTACLREPTPDGADVQAIADMVNGFHASHNIKQVFAEAAGYCSAHL